jgi:hypothetical protein
VGDVLRMFDRPSMLIPSALDPDWNPLSVRSCVTLGRRLNLSVGLRARRT